MVNYTQIQPSKKLNKYIASYILIESNLYNSHNEDFHIVPSARPQLVIVYGDNYFDDTSKMNLPDNPLIGPFKNHRIFKALGKVGIFIIVFRPLGMALLLKDSLTSLKEVYISSDLLPKFIIELKDSLLDAGDIKSRLNIANKMLFEYYSHVEHSKIKIPINEIDNYIVNKKGVINIHELASYFNCSVSKLERNFKELAGLTPKTYAKLIRLRNAIRLTAKIDDLMDITYSLGYYDQAHFIKEFKSFVGESPLKYRNSTRNYTKEFFRNNARELVNL